jgi:virginiamycin B lyase
VPGPDGLVWFSEQGPNRLGRLNPATREIAEFQGSFIPGKEGTSAGGQKHTIRVDSKGLVWSSGVPLTRFDPKTGKFTEFQDVPSAYGIALDAEDNLWYAEFRPNGVIGRVDTRTGQVSKWSPPTPDARPRRLQVDSEGIVWFAEFRAGKIGRFDPRSQSFREYELPGPDPTPYGFEIDNRHRLWYSSLNTDVFGCLDPKTGQVTEYPFPYRENAAREIFRDAKGRLWFGSPPNNKVGYLVVPDAD